MLQQFSKSGCSYSGSFLCSPHNNQYNWFASWGGNFECYTECNIWSGCLYIFNVWLGCQCVHLNHIIEFQSALPCYTFIRNTRDKQSLEKSKKYMIVWNDQWRVLWNQWRDQETAQPLQSAVTATQEISLESRPAHCTCKMCSLYKCSTTTVTLATLSHVVYQYMTWSCNGRWCHSSQFPLLVVYQYMTWSCNGRWCHSSQFPLLVQPLAFLFEVMGGHTFKQ